MGPIHPIYSVRDKCKVDAEVIDVRTTDGAKGPRHQLVGRHPYDGTTVTTFCSETVAEDFKKQLEILPHGLAAEGITILEDSAEQPAPDHIPESTAEIMSADGTPMEDDVSEYIEDPIIGSVSEGTLTTVSEAEEVEVMAAEGPDPEAYDPLTESPVEESPLDEGPSPETFDGEEFGGFDVSLSNYTPVDSVTVEAPLGYGVTQNLGAEENQSEELKKLRKRIEIMEQYFDLEALDHDTCDEYFDDLHKAGLCEGDIDSCRMCENEWEESLEDDNIDHDAETFGVAGIDVQLPSQILVETPDSDQLVVPDPDLFPQGGGRVLGQQTGKVNATPMHAEDDDKAALVKSLKSCIKDLNKSKNDQDWRDKFLDSDDEAAFDSQMNLQIEIANDLLKGLKSSSPKDVATKLGKSWDESDEERQHAIYTINELTEIYSYAAEDDEYDDESREERADVDRYEYERGKEAGEDEPAFFKNKRVLVPTAVIAGLGLAYLTKPELFKGAFSSIADALDSLKGDKSTDENDS